MSQQKEEYLKLKRKVYQTPLEKSIESIIERIDQDIEKIIKLNQLEYV
ncbi:MAG: hypothetical protein ACFFB0_05245 [Promethearchaeota archaeon]